MRYAVNVQQEAVPPLRQMADEAGVGVSDMIEIAVYNLIGCWMKDKHENAYLYVDDVVVEPSAESPLAVYGVESPGKPVVDVG